MYVKTVFWISLNSNSLKRFQHNNMNIRKIIRFAIYRLQMECIDKYSKKTYIYIELRILVHNKDSTFKPELFLSFFKRSNLVFNLDKDLDG